MPLHNTGSSHSSSFITLLDKESIQQRTRSVTVMQFCPPVEEQICISRLILLQKEESLQQGLLKGRDKCINELIIDSQGYVKKILLASIIVDIAVRIWIIYQVLNLDDLFIEKWAYLLLNLIIRSFMVCCLCSIALNLFEDNPVSSWLYRQRTLQGCSLWGLVIPPELFFVLRVKNRFTTFLVVNSIFRGIEVSILFLVMMWLMISYLSSTNSHSQDMLWLLGLLAEEFIRFILLLAYLGCQHPHY